MGGLRPWVTPYVSKQTRHKFRVCTQMTQAEPSNYPVWVRAATARLLFLLLNIALLILEARAGNVEIVKKENLNAF